MESTTITTGLVRASYASLFEPSSINGSDLKFRLTPLIPKSDTETIDKIVKAIKAAVDLGMMKFNWTKEFTRGVKFKLPLRDGDEEQADGENEGKSEEYRGMMFLNASNKTKPGIVDTKSQPIFEEEKVYSGCWGLANLTFYPFSAKGSNGIAVALNHFMKVKDDTKFSKRVSVNEAFGDVDLSGYTAEEKTSPSKAVGTSKRSLLD